MHGPYCQKSAPAQNVSAHVFCGGNTIAMEDQSNRPHRKTKDKKRTPHSGGMYSPAIFPKNNALIVLQHLTLRPLRLQTLDACRSKQLVLMM